MYFKSRVYSENPVSNKNRKEETFEIILTYFITAKESVELDATWGLKQRKASKNLETRPRLYYGRQETWLGWLEWLKEVATGTQEMATTVNKFHVNDPGNSGVIQTLWDCRRLIFLHSKVNPLLHSFSDLQNCLEVYLCFVLICVFFDIFSRLKISLTFLTFPHVL